MTRSTILSLTVAAVLGSTIVASGAVAPPLFYAVIADTQKGNNDPYAEFAQAVERVNQAKPDIVLMPGDLTSNGSENQYRQFMAIAKGLSAPVVYAVGNHEAPAGEAVYRRRFTEFTGQEPYVHRVLKGWHFFILNSVSFSNGKLDHEGAVSEDQLAWLRDELGRVPRTAPIVLSQHHPYHFPASQTANEDDVLDLFAEHELLYTITGHKHYNHVNRDAEGILHLVTGSLSFSCKPKEVGIGYRFVSMLGRDLWTAWVPLEEREPLALISPVAVDSDVTVPVVNGGAGTTCLRMPCSGKGGLITLTGKGREGQPTPPRADGSAVEGGDSSALSFRVPAGGDAGTLFVPLSPTFLQAVGGEFHFTCSEGVASGPASLYRSAVPWTHHRLGRDTAPMPTISLRMPPAGAEIRQGDRIPIVVVVEQVTRRTRITLEINGREVLPDGTGLAVISFGANGLQSKSHRFKNHLYVNDQFVSAIAPDRDVTTWERFTYVVPSELWEGATPFSFKLTAGTPTDGSGANPKENNEDYQAKDFLACVNGVVLVDPRLPLGKARAIGDNSPKVSTFLNCTPSQPAKLSRWSLLVHDLDTAELPAAPIDIVVRAGSAECRARVTLK